MTTLLPVDRGKKRSRDDEQKHDPPSTPATAANATTAHTADSGDDGIARFLATFSPPPLKVARTAIPFVTRHRSASQWHTLPDALIPLVCRHLSSWRDLLRLCRVHRCFYECVVSSSGSAASCWQNVAPIRLRVDRQRDDIDARHNVTVVTVNDRQLLSHTPPVQPYGDTTRVEDAEMQQRQLFQSLRCVPRLSVSGRLNAFGPLIAVLPQFTLLRHLQLHSLTSHNWPGPVPPSLVSGGPWAAFHSLESLTLDSSYRLFFHTFEPLLGLSVRYLAATSEFLEQLMLTVSNASSSAIASSLVYIQCSGSVHWLPWTPPLMPNLLHVHAGEKTTARWGNQPRPVSHKRPAATGSTGRGTDNTDCILESYTVRQSEEWLHSRLTFPSLVCLSLHGKELLELPVLLTLSSLPSLRQLTLSRRPAWSRWHEERALPLASQWLPQLTTVDYLDVQCEHSRSDEWLADLFFTSDDAEAGYSMAAVRRRLRQLSLQLPAAVDEASVHDWRLAESSWPELQQCCLAWKAQEIGDLATLEAQSVRVTMQVAGDKRACTREQLMAARVDRQWISGAGIHEWKLPSD